MTRTSLKKYASRTRQQLAPPILKLHYLAHLAPIRISHPQHRMSHPFASRTTFAYSLTLRPGVGTGIPVPIPNFRDWDWDRFFKILGLASIYQNFGIGIGLGITNLGQNPKKSKELPKVIIEILNNLISMNYL